MYTVCLPEVQTFLSVDKDHSSGVVVVVVDCSSLLHGSLSGLNLIYLNIFDA